MASHLIGPRVGVASLIVDAEGRILIGTRKSSHGAGKIQLPGGHLEYGEDPLDCATREAEEETGLEIKARKFVGMTNDVFEEDQKHYITLFVWCEMEDPTAEPRTMEPDKCEGWSWATLDELRRMSDSGPIGSVLFLPLHHFLAQHQQFSSLEHLRP